MCAFDVTCRRTRYLPKEGSLRRVLNAFDCFAHIYAPTYGIQTRIVSRHNRATSGTSTSATSARPIATSDWEALPFLERAFDACFLVV